MWSQGCQRRAPVSGSPFISSSGRAGPRFRQYLASVDVKIQARDEVSLICVTHFLKQIVPRRRVE
jgi:hypothetical protein